MQQTEQERQHKPTVSKSESKIIGFKVQVAKSTNRMFMEIISTQEVVVAKVNTFLRCFFSFFIFTVIYPIDSPVHHLNNMDHIYRQHKKITLTFIQSNTTST